MFAPAVFRILEPYRWMRAVAPTAVIAHICPDPAKVGFAFDRAQRTCGRVIAVNLVCLQHIAANRLGQGGQQRGPAAHPATHGGACDEDVFARVNLALPIQGAVVGVFAHHHMGNQAGTSHAAIHRATRRQRLCHCKALGAGKLGADVADDLEAARLVVQYLRYVLTNFLQTRAACTAFAIGSAGAVNHIFTGEVLRQSAVLWIRRFVAAFVAFAFKVRHIAGFSITHCVKGRAQGQQRRQCGTQQFKLGLSRVHFLAGAAVAHTFQVREFDLEFLDSQAQRLDRSVALRDLVCRHLNGFWQRLGTHRMLLCQWIY